MDSFKLTKILGHQQTILSQIALGESLENVLNNICLAIEDTLADSSAKCSILGLVGNQLFHRAAPNIDNEYCQIINGVTIGESVGSCGTAAYKNQQVIVSDIASSPLWSNFKDIALGFGLESCWSTPILSTSAEVLGTFAIYHTCPKAPEEKDLEIIDYFVHFTSIAMEKSVEAEKKNELFVHLEQSKQKLEAFTKVMPDITFILSEAGEYVDIYGCAEELLYQQQSELLGKNVNDVLPAQDAEPIMAVIEKTLATNQVQIFEYQLPVLKGWVTFEGRTAPIFNYQPHTPEKRHVVWMARDISNRKKAEQEVKRLAFFDPLTNLPNRRLLNERLTHCIERIKRNLNFGALLFLDLDDFKRINDSLGHSAGDEILFELSQRLSAAFRASDTVARVGGDEFIILLEDVGNNSEHARQEVEVVAQKIQHLFDDKFSVGEISFQVCCSIGICLLDQSNEGIDNVIKFADTAMYRSKAKKGNSYCFYDPQLQTLLEQQTDLESDIVRGVANNEFSAFFQPQVDIHGKLVGCEALIRWHHPQQGLVPPNNFISIAEQYGLIQQLQNFVLDDICVLIKQLKQSDCLEKHFKISINISQSQFNSSTLKQAILSIIEQYDVDPSIIKLEITESMLCGDMQSTILQMGELAQKGFSFSIDDFGTGYASLKHLSAFPLSELKIDKSFIDKVLENATDYNIVSTIVRLAKSLNMMVVAEGVEEKEQFDALVTLGADAIQGFYIAKPMPLSEFISWYQNNLAKAQQENA